MVGPFAEGLAKIEQGNRWSYIDKDGKIVINPQFEEAFDFNGGLAEVRVGDSRGYIDPAGKLVWNPSK
jgi:WG repeat protein